MKTLSRFALALLCLVSYAVGKNTVFENAQLTGSATQPLSLFGYSVAVSGDTVVVGAPGDNVSKGVYGAAYVYVKPATGWANMQQVARLSGGDTAFGGNVAIYRDTIVVGTLGSLSSSHEVYVFVKPEGGWTDMNTPTATLGAPFRPLGPCLCGRIAVNSNTIAVGSPVDSNGGLGSIAVWDKRTTGWRHSNRPDALLLHDNPQGGEQSFYNIAIDDKVIVGIGEVSNAKTENVSRIFVFVRPEGGWRGIRMQTAMLTPANVASTIQFESVAISGNTVIATANRNQNPENPGLVHIWVEPEGGWADTKEIATLNDGNASFVDNFGASAAISGDEIVVGAPKAFEIKEGKLYRGAAYVFFKPAGGWQTASTPDAVLRNSDGTVDDKFGNSMAISNGTIVIGAPHGPMRNLIGEAYVFEK